MTSSIPVFDGHNDVLLRLYKSASSDVVSDFLGGEDAGHIDLKKAKAGSLVGGFVGSTLGRRLPAPVLRTAIVLLGLIAIGVLLSR